jgi:type IV pilus assembly protein PilN
VKQSYPRLAINLASTPFRQDRTLLAGAALAAVLLVGVLGLEVAVILRTRDAAAESRAELERTSARAAQLAAEQRRLEQSLREPANAEVLGRSIFLNALLVRKGISWTRLFSDLEGVFPHDVRLVAVRPAVTPDNHVQLDMVVGAQAPQPVIELLKRLESAPEFGAVAVLTSSPPSQNEPLYRYRVTVSYAQKL